MSPEVFSTYQAAKVCSAHHTTVINWVNEGKLKAYTTPGGHRRIRKVNLLEFMVKYQIPIPQSLKKGKQRILVVDDDTDMLQEYKAALSGRGFFLDFASDGFEVGRKIYRRKPNLIILDFKMPGMDGFEVCNTLHKDKETSDIPIIAATVLESNADKKRIKECGVREYIAKPVDMERLFKTINKILSLEKVPL